MKITNIQIEKEKLELQVKLKEYINLNKLKDNIKKLELEIEDLNKYITSKKTIQEMIKKLENQFNQGQSLDTLIFIVK